MLKRFMALRAEHQIILVVGILLILLAVFWPRETPIFSAGISAKLGNLGGKIQLETLNGGMQPQLLASGASQAEEEGGAVGREEEAEEAEEGSLVIEGMSGDRTFALFYAPWCPHCKKIMPEWEKAKRMNRSDVKIVKIDCEERPEFAQQYGIRGYPTIYFLPYGLNNPKARIEYKGERKGEAFLAFIAKQ